MNLEIEEVDDQGLVFTFYKDDKLHMLGGFYDDKERFDHGWKYMFSNGQKMAIPDEYYKLSKKPIKTCRALWNDLTKIYDFEAI
jgi:hypothetical protein